MSRHFRVPSGYGHRPLNEDELRTLAPSIFAENKHESRSDRYLYIPTIEIVRALKAEGFEPFGAMQGGSRIPGKAEFTKHAVRFRKPDHALTAVGDERFEIALVNSHDGTSGYKLLSGLMRLVCLNGMTTGQLYATVSVPHKGKALDQIIEGTYTVLDQAERVMGAVEDMRRTTLDPVETQIFETQALALRYDDEADAGFAASQLGRARRAADQGTDLWRTFNRIQENLIRGGQLRRGRKDADGRTIRETRSREVRAIDESTKINRALWDMAEMLRKHREKEAA